MDDKNAGKEYDPENVTWSDSVGMIFGCPLGLCLALFFDWNCFFNG
jgi:hypothetical protein